MFHFFACFFGTIQYISPLLYSWAIAGCECFPLDLSLCRWPCKLPGHTVGVGVAHKELRALDFGGLFFLCNILDSLQSKYFFFSGVEEQTVWCLPAFSLLIEPRILPTRGVTLCNKVQQGAHSTGSVRRSLQGGQWHDKYAVMMWM